MVEGKGLDTLGTQTNQNYNKPEGRGSGRADVGRAMAARQHTAWSVKKESEVGVTRLQEEADTVVECADTG